MKLISQSWVVFLLIPPLFLLLMPETLFAATSSRLKVYMAKGEGADSIKIIGDYNLKVTALSLKPVHQSASVPPADPNPGENHVTPNSGNHGWSPAWKD